MASRRYSRVPCSRALVIRIIVGYLRSRVSNPGQHRARVPTRTMMLFSLAHRKRNRPRYAICGCWGWLSRP
jgi:hypothetical protein